MSKGNRWTTERTPREERFWAKVDKNGPNGCWVWTGAKRDLGYGNFGIVEDGRFRCVRAYRMAWQLVGRELPAKPYVLDHKCHNPPCVNPAHLQVALQADNCTKLARSGVFKRNREAAACIHGHPFSVSNTAIQRDKRGKAVRTCLTCYPQTWMWALEKRGPPPGRKGRGPWRGPAGLVTITPEGTVYPRNENC